MTAATTQRRRILMGSLAAFGAATCYAVTAVIARNVVLDEASPLTATALSMLFGTVVMAALVGRGVSGDLTRTSRHAWVLAVMAGTASAWGATSWLRALDEAPVVIVAPLVGISPLVTILLTHLFLQRVERVTSRTVVGAVVVALGVALVAVGGA